MPRLFLEITTEEHRRLKECAALQGKSIEEYVLECTLPSQAEETSSAREEALQQLENFLQSRIQEANREEFSVKTFEQIKQEAPKQAS